VRRQEEEEEEEEEVQEGREGSRGSVRCRRASTRVIRAGMGGGWRDGDQEDTSMAAPRLGEFDASSGMLFGGGRGGVLRAF